MKDNGHLSASERRIADLEMRLEAYSLIIHALLEDAGGLDFALTRERAESLAGGGVRIAFDPAEGFRASIIEPKLETPRIIT